MMGADKSTGMYLLIGGIVIAIVAYFADAIGLNLTDPSGVVGPLQWLGVGVGVVVALVGGYLYFKK